MRVQETCPQPERDQPPDGQEGQQAKADREPVDGGRWPGAGCGSALVMRLRESGAGRGQAGPEAGRSVAGVRGAKVISTRPS